MQRSVQTDSLVLRFEGGSLYNAFCSLETKMSVIKNDLEWRFVPSALSSSEDLLTH